MLEHPSCSGPRFPENSRYASLSYLISCIKCWKHQPPFREEKGTELTTNVLAKAPRSQEMSASQSQSDQEREAVSVSVILITEDAM